jgi:DNA-binding XRE family transcriptional regulator
MKHWREMSGVRKARKMHFGVFQHISRLFSRWSRLVCRVIFLGMENDMSFECDLHRVFCENVRARRLELSLTQKNLADKLGVKQPLIAAIESGRRVPGLATVEAVAKALEISATDLLSESAVNAA